MTASNLPENVDIDVHHDAKSGASAETFETEILTVATRIMMAYTQLPRKTLKVWGNILSELEPDSSLQLVTVSDKRNADVLVANGFIEPYRCPTCDTHLEDRFVVPKTVAFCSLVKNTPPSSPFPFRTSNQNSNEK